MMTLVSSRMVRLRFVQEVPEPPSCASAEGTEQAHDVALAHHEQRNPKVAEEEDADEGQDAPERIGQQRKRKGQQRRGQQADHQADHARKQRLGRDPSQQRAQGTRRARGEIRREDQARQGADQRQAQSCSG